LFCLGLFSAAYSSFLVNSMIGGFILADGLGLGSRPDDFWTRAMTVAVLLTGMTVAIGVSQFQFDPVSAIVAAQAMTVLASPLVAGALWYLTNDRTIMGDQKNGALMNVAAGVGFGLLVAIAWHTATTKVLPALQRSQEPTSSAATTFTAPITQATRLAHG
jgi:Mn2+/Fe2+ NRAMP family transporter